MNPDGRWTATNLMAVQPHTAATLYQSQNPGESLYLPQPDYRGHPGMQATLPPPSRRHLRLVASVVMLAILVVATALSVWFFHYPFDLAEHDTAKTAHVAATKSTATAGLDAKRRKGLQTIQTKLEAYFVQTGRYPLVSQLNSPDWLTANIPDLRPAMLRDPGGSASALATQALPNQYSYQVYADAAQTSCADTPARCTVYVLTAILADGSKYVLHSGTVSL